MVGPDFAGVGGGQGFRMGREAHEGNKVERGW